MGGGRALIVLDTHVVLWLDLAPRRLGRRAGRRLRRELKKGAVGLSAISFWEVGLLVRRNRIRLGTTVRQWRAQLLAEGIREIAVSGEIGVVASEIGGISDPADRLIMATAVDAGATLVSADGSILGWEGDLKVLDASD